MDPLPTVLRQLKAVRRSCQFPRERMISVQLEKAIRNQTAARSPRLTLRFESNQLHCLRALWISHESIPHQRRAEILSHQDRNALIDAQNIRVIPVGRRMESIYKAIAPQACFPHFERIVLRTERHSAGRKASEPAAAEGTTVPSIGPCAGGPPQAV